MNKLYDVNLVAGVAFVVALLAVSLFVGQYDILGAEDGWAMFGITRIPRTVALVLSGAAMAMCGLVMQLLTHNKFVEPTTTGTTEWAGLGLIFVMYFFPSASILGRMGGAIIFAFIGTVIFFLFLRRVSLKSSLIVPIVGIMLGAVVSSVSTFLRCRRICFSLWACGFRVHLRTSTRDNTSSYGSSSSLWLSCSSSVTG